MQSEKRTDSISAARLISSCLVLVALSLHFFAIVLYAMPINPVSVRAQNSVSRYVEPIFYQNWRLFAPEPVDSERGILLRVRLRRDRHSIETTDFIDITSPKISDLQATRFFPNLRYRIVASMLAAIHYRDPVRLRLQDLDEYTAECYSHVENIDLNGEVSNEECAVDADAIFTPPIRELMRSFAYAGLRHIAPEVLDVALSELDTTVLVEAQLRIVHSEPVPFSRRNETSHARYPIIMDSPWLQILPL